MAKWIDQEQQILESHITSYIDKVTDFSKYIEGTPTFVTYYAKDIKASTADVTLQGVHELIGNNSPIKYNKIKHYPIYNIEELMPEMNYDEEDGSSTNIEGSAVIIPNAGMKPLEDDFFIIEYDKRKILFQVDNVEIGSIADKVLYKIHFFYTSYSSQTLEEKQISNVFETVYDSLGPNSLNNKILIEESIYRIIEELKEKRDFLKKRYIAFYYNSDLNTFCISNEIDGVIYDNLLMRFINKNRLFIDKKTINKNIYIEPLLVRENIDEIEYGESIYDRIDKRSYEEYSTKYELTSINQKMSVFDVYKHRYPKCREVNHIPSKFDVEGSLIENEDYLEIKSLYSRNNQKLVCPLCKRSQTHRHFLSEESLEKIKDSLYSFNETDYCTEEGINYISVNKRDELKTPVFMYETLSAVLSAEVNDSDFPIATDADKLIRVNVLTKDIINSMLTDIPDMMFIDFYREDIEPEDSLENIDTLEELKDLILSIKFNRANFNNYIWIPIMIKIINEIIHLYELK